MSNVEKFLEAGGVSQPLYTQKYIDKKENVITELLKRIATLEYEVEKQDNTLEEVNKYVEKMSYSSIVDNPKKDLQKILKKENKNE